MAPRKMINSNRLPVFLMHVPKCAGTSVYFYLLPSFKPSEICPFPDHGVWSWRAADVPGFKLYCGHFTADFLNAMGSGGTRLLVVRHPLDRVISLFDFWRSYRWPYIRSSLSSLTDNGPAIAKGGDLLSFLRTDSSFAIEQIYNPTARQLIGKNRYRDLWPDETIIIQESIQALHSFDWIGTAESFEVSLKLLSNLLGLPMPPTIPQKLSTYAIQTDNQPRETVTKTCPSNRDSQRILRGNRVDVEIYTAACQIVESRARAAGLLRGVRVNGRVPA